MSLPKSAEYEADQKAKRLLATLRNDFSAMNTQVDSFVTVATALRRTVAQIGLSVAQVEALYVDQTFDRRKVDAELYLAQEELRKLNERLRGATAGVNAADKGVQSISAQVDRTAAEHPVFDPKSDGPIPGIEYVGIDYLCEKLGGRVQKSVYRYIEAGKLDGPDTYYTADDNEAGRPRALWIKTKADVAIRTFLGMERVDIPQAPKGKRGISALV